MTIAKALKQLMHEEGLNNISFAQLLGVTPACTSRYIHGSKIPPLNRLIQISQVLNRRITLKIFDKEIQAKFELKELKREVTFDEKLEQCSKPLMSYCLARLHLKKEDAEDIVQETIYRALTMHYTWRPEVSMMTWLIGIAKRIKNRRRRKIVYIENYIESDFLTEEAEEVFRKDVYLFKHIENLDPKSRKYYKLYLNGMPFSQIALEMNTTVNYVKTKIYNLKNYLNKNIKAQAG